MHASLVLLTYGYMISYFVLFTAHFLFSQQVFYLGLSYDCLCDWKEFITLSASSIVLSISEWVCFEVGIIALGESSLFTRINVIGRTGVAPWLAVSLTVLILIQKLRQYVVKTEQEIGLKLT